VRSPYRLKKLNHIFAVVPDCHNSSGYYRVLWSRHIYEGIRPWVKRLIIPDHVDFSWARQGHGIDLTPYASNRAKASEQLWEQIRAAHGNHGLDAVISYCFAFDLDLQVVQETVRLGIPWVNFFCDSTQMFEKVEALARVVSLNWFPETAAILNYQALGVPYLCQPYALNPDFLPDLTSRDSAGGVGFIGLPTTNRITQLGWLRLFGCPVDIRGHGWVGEGQNPFYNPVTRSKRFWKSLFARGLVEKILRRAFWPFVRQRAQGPLSDEGFGEFVRARRVILGLNQGIDAQGRLASYLKFRDVEFPGYGCCYLTEHNADVEAVFEVGEEILTYRNMWEAGEQLRRMEREPKRASRIGYNGRERVLATHTWENRLRQLAEKL